MHLIDTSKRDYRRQGVADGRAGDIAYRKPAADFDCVIAMNLSESPSRVSTALPGE
jgi:hypothetical protein